MKLMKLDGPALNPIPLKIMADITNQLDIADYRPTQDSTTPQVFFNSVYQTFLRAEQASGDSTSCFYKIGDYTMRLNFAGSALAPLITPALEHLSANPSSKPDLIICLWDSFSTGTNMPPPPWSRDDYIARGEVRGYNDGRIFTNFHLGSYTLSMLDTSLNLAIYWTRDARSLPYYESGAPLLTILHWWMLQKGLQLAHAGAVGTSMGGVLLVGKGGSGKSTTCLSCLNSELFYASDDYCLMTTEPVPHVYSLYNTAKLDSDGIKRFPHLLHAVSNANHLDTEKALLLLYKHYTEKITTGFPIKAILLPKVTGRSETRLKEISPAASLKALAASTIFQLPGAGDKDFQSMSRFVKQIPSYILELGYDIPKIPQVISELLSRY